MPKVDITSLKPYPGNARRGDIDMIRASLKKNGQYKPIVVQSGTDIICAGNHTWLAAQAEGWKEIDVHYYDCDDDTARRINLIDNRTNDVAVYDNAALSEILKELEGDYEGTGFEQGDLDKLLDGLSTSDERADNVPGYGVSPSRVSEGDTWVLGDHRLVCGSCTEADVQQQLLENEVVDLIFMDPPYGVAYTSEFADDPELAKKLHHRTDGLRVAADNLGKEGTEQLIYDSLSIAPLRAGGPIYICAPQGDMYPVIWNAAVMGGVSLRQTIVWVKNRFNMGRSDYHYRHELIMYGWKEGEGHYWCGDRNQDTVWEYDRPSASKEHPTMKPIELVEKAILNSSQRGDIVFDPFGGSGTTLLACERHQRKCRILEIDPVYCEVIVSRWEAYTGNKAHMEGMDA